MATLSKRYRLKQSFSAPNVNAVRGKRFSTKIFSQGQEVIGCFYEGRNKPVLEDFILVDENYLIPLQLLELVQEIKTLNYEGKMPDGTTRLSLRDRNAKRDAKNYTTGLFAGAGVGFLVSFYCAHKGWIQPSLRNKILIIASTAILGGYVANKNK